MTLLPPLSCLAAISKQQGKRAMGRHFWSWPLRQAFPPCKLRLRYPGSDRQLTIMRSNSKVGDDCSYSGSFKVYVSEVISLMSLLKKKFRIHKV